MSNITRQMVRAYLLKRADTEPTYLRAREIASDLGGSPKTVAQYLSQLQDDFTDVSLDQWARSKSTTWRLEVSDA